jgi:hypothetical protein
MLFRTATVGSAALIPPGTRQDGNFVKKENEYIDPGRCEHA